MAQIVTAYGKTLRFPDEMSLEEIESSIRKFEHQINPDYQEPSSSIVDDALSSISEFVESEPSLGGVSAPESGERVMAQGFRNRLKPTNESPQDSAEIDSGFAGLLRSPFRGAKQTGRNIDAMSKTISGDLESVEDIANRSSMASAKEMPVEQRQLMHDIHGIDREQGTLGQIGDTLGAASDNKMGTAQLVAEQAPNTVVSLGAGYAGAKAGAVIGAKAGAFTGMPPVIAATTAVGGVVGFLGGMFLGNYMLEGGARAIEKAEGGLTSEEREAVLSESAKKAAVITGIDAVTFRLGGVITGKLGGSIAVQAGARAEAEVLIKAGVDMSNPRAINAALVKNPALKKAAKIAGEKAAISTLSKSKKAGIAATGVTTESIGEGVGEYAGEVAATGEGDVVDATIEALAGFSQSAVEAAYNANRQGNRLDLNNVKKVADDINQESLREGLDSISSAESVDEAIAAAEQTAMQKKVTVDDVLVDADPTLADLEKVTGMKPSETVEYAIIDIDSISEDDIPESAFEDNEEEIEVVPAGKPIFKPKLDNKQPNQELLGSAQKESVVDEQDNFVEGLAEEVSEKPIEQDSANARFSFAGQSAKTANKLTLSEAKEKIANNENPEQVRKDTGWHQGVDGQWRFEIDDSELTVKKPFPSKGQLWGDVYDIQAKRKLDEGGDYGLVVSDVIDHPALFDAYPSIRKLPLSAKQGRGGHYEKESSVNPEGIFIGRDVEMHEAQSILLHEIQHAVQNIEGFAPGGSPSMYTDDTVDKPMLEDGAILKILHDKEGDIDVAINRFEKMFGREPSLGAESTTLSGESLESIRKRKSELLTPDEKYLRQAGEVEARNTQARQQLTAQQRQETSPKETQDTADQDIIISSRNDGAVENSSESFNKKESKKRNGIEQSQAKGRILSLIGEKAGHTLIDSGIITLADTTQDLKTEPQSELKFISDNDVIQGVTFPDGRIALVLENLNEKNFDGVLLHEGLHSSVKSLIGEKTYSNLLNQLHKNLNSARKNDWVKRAYASVPNDTPSDVLTEEVAAYAIEQHVNGKEQPGFVKRWVDSFLSAFKTAILKAKFIPESIKLKVMRDIKPEDLANLSLAALRSRSLATREQTGNSSSLKTLNKNGAKYSNKQSDTDDASHQDNTDEIPEIVSVNGENRATRNSEGNLIHPTKEGINNFWAWFGDSKIVDNQGRPKIVYHGSNKQINIVDKSLSQANEVGDYGQGFYLTGDKFLAEGYAKKREGESYILPVYAKIINPKTIYIDSNLTESELEFRPLTDKTQAINFTDSLQKQGKDGVIVYLRDIDDLTGENVGEFLEEVVIFDPNQIKHAESNNGNFSSKNNDIKFSKRSEAVNDFADEAIDKSLPEETFARKTQRIFQDKFNRFTVIKEWLAEHGTILSDQADVHLAEERYHSKFANQVEDFRNNTRNPLIKKIADAGYLMSDIADFLEAQHAAEANAAIRKLHDDPGATAYGITDEEAKSYLGEADKELAKLANEFRDITDTTKKLRLDNGILNTDITDAWDKAYKHYIPVKGGMDDKPSKTKTGKGLKVNIKNKRRLGHGRRDESVIENILLDHERAIMEVEKNRVGKHIVMMAAEAGRDDLITIGQPEKRKVLRSKATYGVMVDGVLSQSFQTKEAALAYKNKLPSTLKNVELSDIEIETMHDDRIMYSAMPQLAENEINVYIDGHAIRVQINDDLMAQAYGNLGVDGVGWILSGGRILNNFLSKVYTGYNPEFILTNIIRDFSTGVINLSGEEGFLMAAKTLANYPAVFKSLFEYAAFDKSDKWIDIYRKNGGNTGAAYLSDLERLGEEVGTEYAAYQGVINNLQKGDVTNATRAAGKKAFNATLKWIEAVNQAGENAMRLSAFKAMIESDKTVNQAAHVAKNITVNFNRKGERGAEMNAAYLFFNASIQGLAASGHALFKGRHKHQAQALTASMAYVGYMAAMAFGGGDEDEYDQLNDYTKERNVVIKNNEGWTKIPIPYGYGFAWNFGRIMADSQRRDDLGKAPWRLTANAIQELSPFGDIVSGSDAGFESETVALGALPTAAKIAAQPIFNRSSFSGSPLMPDNFFDGSQPDREKMWRSTKGTLYDATAGWLQNVMGLDISPETLKHVTRSFTGGAGALVDTTVSSAMLKKEGVDLETREMPFIRKLYAEITISDKRSSYYKAVEEAKKTAEEFGRIKRKNDVEKQLTFAKQNREMLYLNRYANALRKYIKASRDRQDAVRTSDEFSEKEKRLKLKSLESEESKLYDRYLDVFNIKKLQLKERNEN